MGLEWLLVSPSPGVEPATFQLLVYLSNLQAIPSD